MASVVSGVALDEEGENAKATSSTREQRAKRLILMRAMTTPESASQANCKSPSTNFYHFAVVPAERLSAFTRCGARARTHLSACSQRDGSRIAPSARPGRHPE